MKKHQFIIEIEVIDEQKEYEAGEGHIAGKGNPYFLGKALGHAMAEKDGDFARDMVQAAMAAYLESKIGSLDKVIEKVQNDMLLHKKSGSIN